MLEAQFLSNGHLQVIETTHSWTDTKRSYWYFDLEKGLKSLVGKEGETPTARMTNSQLLEARKLYVPTAERQKDERDSNAASWAAAILLDPLLADPDRFEKARRWATMVTASLVSDGSYDTMTREEVRHERAMRYEMLRATLRMPTNGEIAVAKATISERDGPSSSDRAGLRERQTQFTSNKAQGSTMSEQEAIAAQKPEQLTCYNITMAWRAGAEGTYSESFWAADETEAKLACATEMADSGEIFFEDDAERSSYIKARMEGYADVTKAEDQFLQDFDKLFGDQLFGKGPRLSIDMDKLTELLVANRDQILISSAPVERPRG